MRDENANLDAVIEAAYRKQIDPHQDPYTGPYVPTAHFDVVVGELQRMRDGIRRFLADEDTHEPGPYVKDGNWHPGPCVEGGPRMEDVYPDGFQICADDECGLYWPCPAAELAALLADQIEVLPGVYGPRKCACGRHMPCRHCE